MEPGEARERGETGEPRKIGQYKAYFICSNESNTQKNHTKQLTKPTGVPAATTPRCWGLVYRPVSHASVLTTVVGENLRRLLRRVSSGPLQ